MKEWFKQNWILLLVIVSCMALLLSIYFGVNTQNRHETSRYSYQLQCLKESELKYWENKSKLTDEIQNYMEIIAPTTNLRALDLIDKCAEYRVDIIFTLAQGEIESHFGTRGIASKINSVWNVGVFDSLTVYTVKDKDIYRHPNESIEPYLKLLTKNYLVGKDEHDLMHKYVDKNGLRYASDPDYEKKLMRKYQDIYENTKIDSLQLVVKHYAIKCNKI